MKTQDSLVSCVVPVYNGEKFLGEAIDSIQAQTYRPIEIIVIDDGSTDGTAQVIERYRDRIKSARQENAGAPTARNHGVRLAGGEFVAFLDADDLWHERKLELQIELLTARPEIGYCLAYMQNFWVEELSEEATRLKDHELAKPQPGTISTLVARHTLFERIGLLNTKYRNRDLHDWMLRAERQGVAREILAQVLLSRRIHNDNVSRQRSREELFDLVMQRRRDHSSR